MVAVASEGNGEKGTVPIVRLVVHIHRYRRSSKYNDGPIPLRRPLLYQIQRQSLQYDSVAMNAGTKGLVGKYCSDEFWVSHVSWHPPGTVFVGAAYLYS